MDKSVRGNSQPLSPPARWTPARVEGCLRVPGRAPGRLFLPVHRLSASAASWEESSEVTRLACPYNQETSRSSVALVGQPEQALFMVQPQVGKITLGTALHTGGGTVSQ